MATLGGASHVEGSANSLEMENLARFAVDEHKKKEVLSHLFSFVLFFFGLRLHLNY